MSDPDESLEELPEAVVQEHGGGGNRLSTLWIIPVIAAIIGLSLAYRSYQDRGVKATISFKSASGLAAGKTPIRYLGVTIGTVDRIDVGEKLEDAIVSVSLRRESATHLVEKTRFWIVKPRIGTGGVSGLSTLISGDYIAIDPGPAGGTAKTSFVGLPEPPLDAFGWRGIRVELRARRLDGIEVGSPVLYRDVIVGAIGRHEFDGDELVLEALINEPYRNFVHQNSRFWNASGFEIDAGLKGVKLHLESAMTLIEGGVSFDTFGKAGGAAKDGAAFRLFANKERAKLSYQELLGLHIAVEAPKLGSIKKGDPVLYREMPVGRVLGYDLHPDGRSVGILIQIDSPYEKLVRSNSKFWNASGISADLSLTGLHIHSESLESLLAGGVAFATPDSPGQRVAKGSVFELHDEARDSWLEWSPNLASQSNSAEGSAGSPPPVKEVLVHHKDSAKKSRGAGHWFKGLFGRK